MKKRQGPGRLLFFIFTLFMSLCFSGCFLFDGGKTVEKGVLRVGMNLNIDKLCYLSPETNKPEGFEVELAGLLADRLDLELEIVDTTEKNLLKSLDGRIYDCVISGVGLSQWNRIHYGYTDAYLDLSLAEEQTEEEDTRIAIFTRKGNSLEDTLEKNLEELKEEGTLKELSVKYFGKDITT
ncbi:MAG TPA: transporter substrate-binding domain-containing protein [Candidatus Blautia stercoripullorum]|uniref:Transporter substrate-binding domain-containing protein n=1 Tax=Candidatus Blautia stercoripullorum TaxID=2838502 RepID=A0A9D2R850_9FIRM|nr:transporter substrate-binding domain-containing protein [Candidatus Blautia stercoripullorum]